MAQKLGDLLLELRDPNLPTGRQGEIVRLLNELGDREEKYKTILGANGIRLENPIILNPSIINGLSVMTLNRTTDLAITTATDTPVSFETNLGLGSAFQWTIDDPTKIRVTYPGQGVMLIGKLSWASDATGYRNCKFAPYDQEDNLIGSANGLQSHAGWAGSDNIVQFVNVIPQGFFPQMAYFKLTVAHTKGSDLDLLNMDAYCLAV